MAKLTYADIIERDQRAQALAELGLRFELIDTPRLMTRLVDLVAPEHLDLLAESSSILGEDGYWLAESESARRKLIKGAYELHRFKGTPWAIREIIRRLGFGEVTLIEGLNRRTYNGETKYDGVYVYGSPTHWAHYRVIMANAITNDQAALLRKTLRAFAPARCVLESLDYMAAALRYNAKTTYNGNFNYGTA